MKRCVWTFLVMVLFSGSFYASEYDYGRTLTSPEVSDGSDAEAAYSSPTNPTYWMPSAAYPQRSPEEIFQIMFISLEEQAFRHVSPPIAWSYLVMRDLIKGCQPNPTHMANIQVQNILKAHHVMLPDGQLSPLFLRLFRTR